MQFRYYNDVNLYDYKLSEPIFDSTKNIFMSKFLDGKDKEFKIKSASMRFLNSQDKYIRTAFLHSTNDFYQFIKNIDSYLRDEAEKHLSNILGTINKETLDNLFKSSILLPDKIPELPMMMFTLNDNCKFAGLKRRKVSFEDFKENTTVEVHFTISGVNYYKNKYEIIYDVQQLKMIDNYCETIENLINNKQDIELDNNDDE